MSKRLENSMIHLPDGHYGAYQAQLAMGNEFKSEKNMCDFIEWNIVSFAHECLGIEYKSHKREFTGFNLRNISRKRLDFVVESSIGERIGIECKNPTSSDICSAIGQALSYLVVFKSRGIKLDKMVIVSSKIDVHLGGIIDEFNLPLEYIVIGKSKFMKFVHGSSGKKPVLAT